MGALMVNPVELPSGEILDMEVIGNE